MTPLRVIQLSFLPADGMAIYPFILVKREEHKKDTCLLTHEKIHLAQQAELLVLPFYLLYIINYLINLCLYRNHRRAYLNIVFEREAYAMELTPGYLKKRKYGAWLKFIK